MTDARTIWMLVALSAANFTVTSSGSATAPFLQQIAEDLGTTLPAIAHLFAVQAITWGTAALVAGTFALRLGRRSVLVASVVLLAATRIGFALSPNYAAAFTWQLVSGVCGGAFMGTVFAAVSDHVPAGARGRALSWVITGQSLSLVLGVPLVTLLGALGGWREALGIHGGLTLLTAVGVRLATPPDPPAHPDAHRTRLPFAALAQPKLMALLVAGTTERVCFATLAIYLPTYLLRAYGVSFGALALALAVVAVGNLIGNLVGGRIADRTRSRGVVFAASLALTAVLAIPTLMWKPGLGASVTLGFAYCFANAAGRPALMATLAAMPSEVRGALFGLNVTTASLGWLLAGSVGAWLIVAGGFIGLGAFCAGMAAAGTLLALASVPGKTRSA
jgi:MFS transporter, DHA1 family, inner membrane transport protein